MITDIIYKHMRDYERKNYHMPRFIIMTPQQRADIRREDWMHVFYGPVDVSETYMGILVHVAPADLNMHDWLYYESAIDIRSEDGIQD